MNARMRDRYLTDSVTTASPGTLLVQLYDRLVLDLQRGEHAARQGDRAVAGAMVGHAQDIISELHATLRVDVWDGGPGLARLYEFCLAELIQAMIKVDADRIAGVCRLVEPLRDAWREAARIAEPTPAATLSA